jgi:tryptophan 7-halogenase
MKNNLIKKIVIVGGGSSGWLSAAYLSNNFPHFKITIIDKEISTPVGVGEATLLNFKTFLKACGFNLNEWFNELDSTEKLGILFPNWIKEKQNIYHPFVTNITSAKDYKKRLTQKLQNNGNVAYHVDCGKLIGYIKNKLKEKIVFKKLSLKEVIYKNNLIEKLILKNNEEITGDLYIDCTGFKSILKKDFKKVNLKDRLICDTAVAGSINYLNEKIEKTSFVKCDAVDEGWVWSIPVKKRIGSGFIFNREITNIEDAKLFFINFWNKRIKKENIKTIDWTPFYQEEIWNKNVVSIGLSAGFLEPLESTGLALTMEGIFQLSKRIYKNFYNENDIEIYNSVMKLFFENSIDFVNMHYLVSKRKGIFWEKGRKLKKSDKFLIYKNCIKEKNFNHFDEIEFNVKNNFSFNDNDFFTFNNWYCWLTQSIK